MIVKRREEWIPPTDSIKGFTEIYDSDLLHNYWYAFYTAVFLLRGIETNPKTDDYLLTWYAACLIICGALF
jgi:hypothetical protein